jgi:hypothetical protein
VSFDNGALARYALVTFNNYSLNFSFSPSIIGDFPSPTSKHFPYVFSENDIIDDEYDQMFMQ